MNNKIQMFIFNYILISVFLNLNNKAHQWANKSN